MADAPWLKYQPPPSDGAAPGPWAKYGSAPPPKNPTDAAVPQSHGSPVTEADEQHPVQDAMDFAKGLLPGAGKTLSGIGGMVAHPINTAKALPGAVGGMLSTGANAVMHPVDTTQKVKDYLKNIKPEEAGEEVGGIYAGGAAGKAAGVLGDVVGPSVKALVGAKPVSQAVKDLAGKGVVTTPGQRAGHGSLTDTAEQKLMSLPVGGQSIAARRGESITKWSEDKLDDALKDVGGKPVPANKTGRDAYLHTYTEIQNSYNSLLPKMTGDLGISAAPGTPSLNSELGQIRQAASAKGNGMRPTEKAHLLSILDDDVIGRFDASGKASGQALGDIKDVLDKEIKGYKSGNNSERKVAEALEQVQTKVNDMLRRENPQLSAELKKTDAAYAKFQTAMLASKYAGKDAKGSFTPNQYLRSVESRDPTKNKRAFGTGTAPGQKEAESASKILGNTVPDSGTAGRMQMIEMLKNPWGSAGGLTASALTPIIYSKPVQKLLQSRALKKGGPYTPIGPSATLGGAALGPGMATDNQGLGQ